MKHCLLPRHFYATVKRWLLPLCLTGAVIGFVPNMATAQFTTLTNELLANTTTAGAQWGYSWSVRTVAVQPDGGYIIVWIDFNGLDGNAEGIFGQRFNASGAKVGSQFQANTTFSGQQYSPAVAVAPDGSFIVAWEGPGSSIDVWAQRFSKTGVRVGTEFLLNTTTGGNQKYPEIQYYPDGTFVAAFVDASQTVLQRFDAEGRTIGQETRISSGTGSVVLDGLCVRPDKSLLLTWTSGGDVYGQFFDPNLQAIGTETRMNTYLTGTQQYSIPRVDGAGNFVVVWESDAQDGSGTGIYGRRFDKNFSPLSGEFAITTNTTNNQYEPQIAVHSSGRFIVAWSDNNNRDGGGTAGGDSGASLWMREFDANGNPVGSETMVNQSTTGYQAYPVIDINAGGRFVISFEGNGTQAGQIDDYGVFVRAYQLSSNGATALSVTPTATVASDIVTITMTLTAPTTTTNVLPNPLSVSGTNGVFATLVSGPTPLSTTVGTTPVTFTWTYKITSEDDPGVLTFTGNAYTTSGVIFPNATSNTITVKPAIYLSDMTAPNLIGDSNIKSQPTAGPRVFTIAAKLTNAGLNPLSDVEIYLGDGTTPGTFPITTMTLAQTNNTYQGAFSLTASAGTSDCTRSLITLGAAKTLIAGGIDFNGDGIVNTSDDGVLSNGKTVIDGRVDVNLSGTITTTDDLARPPGLFYGYREPPIIDGYIDNNNDGVISALDAGTYGGETHNIYWQVTYQVLDAFGEPTWGNASSLDDDLRYKWVVWTKGKDGATPRTDVINDFAKVRNEIAAAANKISPNPNGYISGGPPRVILGKIDINSDGIVNNSDDGTYYGKTVIDGSIDMNGSGTITITDDGVLNSFPVIDGNIDVDRSGVISIADNAILVQPGQVFTVTIHNADFGSIGSGFDENRDGLSDYDFWYQPIGKTDFPTTSFRLVDIQADITGNGGSSPLNGITSHYDNEPYLSRLIGDVSGGFTGTYTYTFLAITTGNGFLTPYQEAASGSDNEKYNGDFGAGVSVITGTAGLSLSKLGSPRTAKTCDTLTWTMSYQNTGTTEAGDPGSGNGVVIEDVIPTNAVFVANSATCGTYACTVYYSTNNGTTWSSTQPAAATVNRLRWHIDQAIPVSGSGTAIFKTTIANCPTSITNQVDIKIGAGAAIATASDVITVQNTAPVVITCAVTRNISGCTTSNITGPAFSTTSATSSEAVFENATNQGNVSDDCKITSVTYSDVAVGACPIVVTRTWVFRDTCGSTITCVQTLNVNDTTNPLISCVANQSKTGTCYYTVTGTEFDPTTSDNCGIQSISYLLSGATSRGGSTTLVGVNFNAGTTTVLWTIIDNCNNTATCSFTVTVTANLVITVSSAASAICSGGALTLNASLSSALPSGCGVQWQSYTGSAWADILGATSLSYPSPTLTATTKYRVVVTCSP